MEKPKRPRLFIASSTESLDRAYAAQNSLRNDAEVTVWSQGIFGPSLAFLESLVSEASSSDFALLILSADDVVRIRGGEEAVSARDNIIFEIGLFTGRIGRERTFFAIPGGVDRFHLPTDLAGINPLVYEIDRADRNWEAAMAPACFRVRSRIRDLGPREADAAARIAPEIIQSLNKLMDRSAPADAQPDIASTLSWLEAGLITMDLPVDARDELIAFIKEFKIHPYGKQFFIRWMHKTREYLRCLSAGTSFIADRDVQFELAASLAQVFKNKELETVYATTFDPPGDFKTKFGRVYFEVQRGLRVARDSYKEDFQNLIRPEIDMLEKMAGLSPASVGELDSNRSKACPAKARIVVAKMESLLEEFKDVGAFTEFNRWHLEERFGLRYLVLSAHDYENIQFRLRYLPPHSDNEPIVDFIVYNTEVVFGRTNARPEVDEARIRMLHSIQGVFGRTERVRGYKAYFENNLWPEAMPLSELWKALDRWYQGQMPEEYRTAMQSVGNALVKLFKNMDHQPT